MAQNFGTGGSPSAAVNTYAGQATISTSWARYSVTVAVPSISGKTIGTNNDDHLRINIMLSAGSDFNARSGSLGVQNNTFQIWGVQVEYGSKATPFQTASGGSIQGELAMCQRYYQRWDGNSTTTGIGIGIGQNTTNSQMEIRHKTTMRVAPTAVERSGGNVTDHFSYTVAISSLAFVAATVDTTYFIATTAVGLIISAPNFYQPSSGYFAVSAEL